jgi:hypothetical protein
MRYFSYFRRNDEGVAKQAISIPNSKRKREMREEKNKVKEGGRKMLSLSIPMVAEAGGSAGG